MTAPAKPWLTLIGIGEDGADGLIPAARAALAQASLVVGGARHLALAGPLAAKAMVWPSPIADAVPEILAHRGEPVAVLASRRSLLLRRRNAAGARMLDRRRWSAFPRPRPSASPPRGCIGACRTQRSFRCMAAISSASSRRCSRAPEFSASAWDETTAPRIAKLLCERGLGRSMVTVLEAMGGPRERIRAAAGRRLRYGRR